MALLAEYAFNEGAGTTVADSSGNGHTLTLPSPSYATWTAGKNGGALYGGPTVYGKNAAANGAHADVLPWFPFAGSWTVALWAKIPAASGPVVWSINQDAAGSQQFTMSIGNDQVWFYWLNSGSPYATTATWNDNVWHHWAWAYNAATKTSAFYVDGAPASMAGWPPANTNLTATWPAAQLAVAGIPFADQVTTSSSNATVDDFRIFDTALTQSQVQTWMNTPAGAVAGPNAGTAAGSVHWTPAATGSITHAGSATRGVHWTATATGTAPTVAAHTGTGAQAITWSPTATGTTQRAGNAATGITWTATANGSAPTVGEHAGAAAATIAWAATADGTTARTGTATQAIHWTTTASGAAPVVGSKSGTGTAHVTWIGAAVGQAPAVGPHRDIDAYGGTIATHYTAGPATGNPSNGGLIAATNTACGGTIATHNDGGQIATHYSGGTIWVQEGVTP